MLKRIFLVVCGLACFCVKAQDTNKITQSNAFFYALPENYFQVRVKVQKETFYKGPLAEYAGGITGISSTVKENKVQYKILSITLETYARADENQLYKLKNTCKRHYFRYLSSGLLNMERKTAPNSSKTSAPLSFQGGEYSPFEGGRGMSEFNPNYEKKEVLNRFPIYSADAVMEKYDTVYAYEDIDSVLVQVPHVTRSLVIKPTKRQAEEAMENLGKIREARWLLISGDHEVDFSQLEIMLAELKKMENDYLALFSGMLETEEKEYVFTVYPTQKADIFSLPLFRFSASDGITEKEIGTITYSLNFRALASQNEFIKATTADEKQKKKMDNSGATVYYRLPQVYTIALMENGKQSQVLGQYPVAQLGEVLSLPKKVKRFQLDPFTGGLKVVKF
jgi:hypothetical protein